MKNRLILIVFFIFVFNKFAYSNEMDCNKFKKFSANYMMCKTNLIKNKTISAGKNIIEDTKNYQKKEWSEEKKKLNRVKDKINETKEKVLN